VALVNARAVIGARTRPDGDGAEQRAASILADAVSPGTRRLWRILGRTAAAGGAAFLLWLAGLIWFATPPSAEDGSAPTDAIVVLTGGRMRLQSGIELLREGKGRKLFVSGVNQQVDLDELLRISGNASAWAACCTALGHEADDTRGNARETAQWVQQEGFRSLRLVTAWYHMPRSLLEFDRAMPEIEIIAHPVFPDQVKRERWWVSRATTALLVSEYSKYLGAVLRHVLERLRSVIAPEPAWAKGGL
jgi:uncharacterized SAM-binding protein YcdF (DUF218 family)